MLKAMLYGIEDKSTHQEWVLYCPSIAQRHNFIIVVCIISLQTETVMIIIEAFIKRRIDGSILYSAGIQKRGSPIDRKVVMMRASSQGRAGEADMPVCRDMLTAETTHRIL